MLLPLSTFNIDTISIPNTRIAKELLIIYATLFDNLKRHNEITISDLGKDSGTGTILKGYKLSELLILLRVLQATRVLDIELKRWRRDSVYIRSKGLFDVLPGYRKASNMTLEQYAAGMLWGLFLRRGSICRSILQRALTDTPEEEVPMPSLPMDPSLYDIVLAHIYPETVRSWPESVGSSLGKTTVVNKFNPRTDVGVLLVLMSISGMIALDSSKVEKIARPATLKEYPRSLRKHLSSVLGDYVGLSQFLELAEKRVERAELPKQMPEWQKIAYEVSVK